jgi:hypothetical protein
LNDAVGAPLETGIRIALRDTARRLERDLAEVGFSKVGEAKHLKPAFRASLTSAGIVGVQPSEKRLSIRSWEPQGVKGRLGGVDVIVGTAPAYRAFFELKWAFTKKELGWTLWDVYKLVAARLEYGVRAFAIVGAPLTYWHDDAVGCSALYCDAVWNSRELFTRYADDWKNLLGGGAARPVRIPAKIETRLVAAEPLKTSPGWELRALEVDIPGFGWLDFDGDWPAKEDYVAVDD